MDVDPTPGDTMSLWIYLRHEPCPHCDQGEQVFEANTTHNLGAMAVEAGIYKHLWRPDEIGVTVASQLIGPLQSAIAKMLADPDRFKAHNVPNGWGMYDDFMPWLTRLLDACEEYPSAKIRISR
jgi:hypothetical protein